MMGGRRRGLGSRGSSGGAGIGARGPRPGPAPLGALLLASAAACCAVWAFEWPVAPVRLAATFGTPGKGRIVTGVAVAGEDALVRAIDDGEVSFSYEEGAQTAGIPSALGSFIVVEHPRDMAAVYAHLAPGSVSSYLSTLKQGAILGKTGASGWAEGPGLLAEIYDRKAGRWVNPLLLLPPVADAKPPVIRSIGLLRAGKVFALGEAVSVPQGTYSIAVDLADALEAPWSAGPLAPYGIRLSMDGAEIAKEVFDVAEGRDGRLNLFPSSPKTFAEYRTRDGRYVLAERLLPRGRVVFEVSAEDLAGNRRSASWSVAVE